MKLRIGQGIDFHRFEKGEGFILGGVFIPCNKKVKAHSDGDVLLHAICDALLGSIGLPDIGQQFPDNDPAYKDIESTILLKKVYELVQNKGFRLVNLDATIILQEPRIALFSEQMKIKISKVLKSKPDQISVKATTSEKMGFAGREEGIAAQCIVLVDGQN